MTLSLRRTFEIVLKTTNAVKKAKKMPDCNKVSEFVLYLQCEWGMWR
jgi:hypothetical protein